ncbi:Protein O-mannosyltransferase 2, partial [Coemansia sp. RSA 1813]
MYTYYHATTKLFSRASRNYGTDAVALPLLTIISGIVRLWQIGRVDRVVWDEAHFGRFGSMYLNGTYIHDVHPPLGKLIIALAEHLATARNSTFEFGGGAKYPSTVNHTFLRAQIAVFGILLAPLAYVTVRWMGAAQRSAAAAAAMAAWFVIFDNALCLMTRIVVLDGPLLCFTALTLAATMRWWLRAGGGEMRWIALTGVSLALATSVKWVGVFSVMLVGVLTVVDIVYRFLILADRIVPRPSRARIACTLLWIIAIRALLLIVLPLCVYAAVFRIHFAMQTQHGVGEHKMPIRFQANLRWNRYNRQPTNVAYNGSIAKLWPDSKHDGCGKLLAFRPPSSVKKKKSLKDPQHVGYGSVLTGADWWAFQSVDNGARAFVCDGCMVRLVHDTTQMPLQLDDHRKTSSDGDDVIYPVIIAPAKQENNIDDSWTIEIVSQELALLNDGLIHPIST